MSGAGARQQQAAASGGCPPRLATLGELFAIAALIC